MPSHATTTPRNPLTFGIELEFLFYYLLPSGSPPSPTPALTIPAHEEARLPPPLTFPADFPGYRPLTNSLEQAEMADLDAQVLAHGGGTAWEESAGEYNGDDEYTAWMWAKGVIEEAILSVPGARVAGREREVGEEWQGMYADSGWKVKEDGSIREEGGLKVEGYGVVCFEVNSPVLWDRPESHRHVHAVVAELGRRFRLRVNRSTGFHCHVGNGVEELDEEEKRLLEAERGWLGEEAPTVAGRRHSLRVLKRAAALMWAADGFLCHAHPSERGENVYSQSIRLRSRLAHGVRQQAVCTEEHGPVTLEEVPLRAAPRCEGLRRGADVLQDELLPSKRIPRQFPNMLFPAVRPAVGDVKLLGTFWAGGDDAQAPNPPLVNTTVESGVAHIMACKGRERVAQLLDPCRAFFFAQRQNYNFKDYRDAEYARSIWAPNTVEFREAAGALEADWVSAWSNICLGFFRFAREASDARFWAVIRQLAEAEAAGQSSPPREHAYDMITLLFDMGLVAEGLFLERKLREDPLRFWYPTRLG